MKTVEILIHISLFGFVVGSMFSIGLSLTFDSICRCVTCLLAMPFHFPCFSEGPPCGSGAIF
jgi:hypothetical protein